MVEGVPNCFLRVSYEDAFLRLGFELFRLKFLDISIASPNFQKRQLRFVAKPQLYGVVSTDFDGALFKVNAAVSNS